jgi:hypothetical protein
VASFPHILFVTAYAAPTASPRARACIHVYLYLSCVTPCVSSSFLCTQVQQYLTAIDAAGGIYTHRWGDAPIQTTALALFAPTPSVVRIPTDYLHVSTMNRIFRDGHVVDGYHDSEMQRHPLVRAHLRLLSDAGSHSAHSSNCSSANTSVGCADGGATEVILQHLTTVSYTVEQSWSALTTATLDAIALGFTRFFSVDCSAVSIRKGISSHGATNDVQV